MSETNDSTFCEDGDHFKIVREGSKYEQLKAEVEKANQKRCTCSGFAVQYDGCSCENGKAQSFAISRLHEFERKSAGLIDEANKRIAELESVNKALLEALEGIMYFDDEKYPDGHRYGFIEIDLENERLERARIAIALAKGGVK